MYYCISNKYLKLKNMNKILKQIDKLIEQIEMGLITKSNAQSQIKSFRSLALDKFEQGSEEFENIIYSLIDANSLLLEY